MCSSDLPPTLAAVIVPRPPPREVFVRESAYTTFVKVAVTLRAWVIESVQVPVPVQPLDQPVKVERGESALGVAVSVTDVP